MSPNVKTVERRVVTLVDAIHKIGGLFGALSTFILIISLKIQKILYELELIRKTVRDNEVPFGTPEDGDFS